MKLFKFRFHRKKTTPTGTNLPAVITRVPGVCPVCQHTTAFELKLDQGDVNVYCSSCKKLVLFINKNIPTPFHDIAILREGEFTKIDEIFKPNLNNV